VKPVNWFIENLEPVDQLCKNKKYTKWNSKDNKLEVSHDSERHRMDLKATVIWYFSKP
jgi:hypothetical protein